MKKEKNAQANYRLPESLLTDLKFVSEETGEPQAVIVRSGVQAKVETLKKKIQKQKAKDELVEVVAA